MVYFDPQVIAPGSQGRVVHYTISVVPNHGKCWATNIQTSQLAITKLRLHHEHVNSKSFNGLFKSGSPRSLNCLPSDKMYAVNLDAIKSLLGLLSRVSDVSDFVWRGGEGGSNGCQYRCPGNHGLQENTLRVNRHIVFNCAKWQLDAW